MDYWLLGWISGFTIFWVGFINAFAIGILVMLSSPQKYPRPMLLQAYTQVAVFNLFAMFGGLAIVLSLVLYESSYMIN